MMAVAPADVFFFSEKEAILVRLPSFEWNFSLGLLVRLQVGDHVVDMRQIGIGNHEGRATLLLSPLGNWNEAHDAVLGFVESGSMIGVSEIGCSSLGG